MYTYIHILICRMKEGGAGGERGGGGREGNKPLMIGFF